MKNRPNFGHDNQKFLYQERWKEQSRWKEQRNEFTRLYLGNLRRVDEHDIRDVFEKFGKIIDLWLARDPPGFGFLTFENKDDAEKAVQEVDGMELHGSRIKVEIAKEPVESSIEFCNFQKGEIRRERRNFRGRNDDRSYRRRSRSYSRRRHSPSRSRSNSRHYHSSRYSRSRSHRRDSRSHSRSRHNRSSRYDRSRSPRHHSRPSSSYHHGSRDRDTKPSRSSSPRDSRSSSRSRDHSRSRSE